MNIKKRYLIIVSLIAIILSLMAGAFSLFTDYQSKLLNVKAGVSLEFEENEKISDISVVPENKDEYIEYDKDKNVWWCKSGTTVAINAVIKEGYDFIGWYNGQTQVIDKVNGSYTVNGYTILSAKLNATEYKITYDPDGGLMPEDIDDKYTIEEETKLPTPSKVGYEFEGWVDKNAPDSDPITTLPKGTTGDKEYVAEWTPITYSVKFNANGGSGAMNDLTLTYDVEASLPVNTFTRTGYDFVGWATSANGAVIYADKASVKNLNVASGGTVHLYAVWKEKEPAAFAVYSADDTSLAFYKRNIIPSAGDSFEGKTVTAVYTGIEELAATYYSRIPWYSYRSTITQVHVVDEISPISTAFWFYDFMACTTMELTKLNTSNVTNMSNTFYRAGYNTEVFEMGDLSNWNVSKVTNMSSMFYGAGRNATTWHIGDLSNWDISKVTNMSSMFSYTGYTAEEFNIGDLSNWNVSKVTNMSSMFYGAGRNATTWNIGDLGNWDVANVTNMSYMFYYAGYNAEEFDIGDLSNWNVSKVTDMSSMFSGAGYNTEEFDIGDLSNWNVSKVTDMSRMFFQTGDNATTWNIGDLSSWNVSKVTDMSYMFSYAGRNATTWNIGDLSNWDVSNVTNMSDMFVNVGGSTTTWNIGDLSSWNVSRVTNMSRMFHFAGYNTEEFDIGNLSQWDVSKVTSMYDMFGNAGYNATTWNIGDLSSWNVSNVTDMSRMFYYAGYTAEEFDIGDIGNWDVSNVTDMSYMFIELGEYASTIYIGDLGEWDVSKVTDMSSMFNRAGNSATTWYIGNLSNWDVSSVTDMSHMFYHMESKDALDLSSWNVSKVTSYKSFNELTTVVVIAPSFGATTASFSIANDSGDTVPMTEMIEKSLIDQDAAETIETPIVDENTASGELQTYEKGAAAPSEESEDLIEEIPLDPVNGDSTDIETISDFISNTDSIDTAA